MPVRVKIDEHLPLDVAAAFSRAGHRAATVREQGLSGSADAAVWEHVQSEGRWLVTADKEFGDVRRFRPSRSTGIMLLRAEEESRRAYVDLAQGALAGVALDDVGGCLLVVTPRGIRRYDFAARDAP